MENLFAGLDQPFEFIVKKKSFAEFLDSYLDLAQSEDAPLPPWVVFTQLPSLTQRAAAAGASSQPGRDDHHAGGKRKPRVMFDDDVECGSKGTKDGNAGGTSSAGDGGTSAHRQAVVKKTKGVLDSLHLQPAVELPHATIVRDYMAVKALIEFLPPSNALVPCPPSTLLKTPAFLGKMRDVVDGVATISAQQHTALSARFKRLALRRSGTSSAEGSALGHHFGTRHAFQLYLRSLLTAEGIPIPSSVNPQTSNSRVVGQRSAAAAAAAASKAATRPTESVLSALPKVLQQQSPWTRRDDVLRRVEEQTGLPYRVVSQLHLQSHGFQKDSKTLGINSRTDNRGDSLPSASATARRAMSVGQLSSVSSQKNLRGGSAQSSGVFDAQQDPDSDTRSVRSSATSHTAASSGSNLVHLPYVCPPWKLQQEDYWISLKGVVFRIRATHPSGEALLNDGDASTLSAGRMLYYRLVLLPVYSGRDITTALAWLQRSCPTTDFLPLEAYVAKLRVRLGQQADVPQTLITEETTASPAPLGPPATWPPEVKQRLNAIFDLFVKDFEVVGELEDGHVLWF